MPTGYWCPVLHAHLPYVRHPEYPEFLEEDWFFEALTETYVPLVRVLDGFLRDGVDYRLTMTLSPPLLSMMQDDLLVGRYHRYLDRLVDLSHREVERTQAHDHRFAEVTRFYEGDRDRVAHRNETLHAMEARNNPIADLAAHVARTQVATEVCSAQIAEWIESRQGSLRGARG